MLVFRKATFFFLETKIETKIPPDYCIEPESGGCNAVDETSLVMRPKSTHCQDKSSDFSLDVDRGTRGFVCENVFRVD